MKYISTKKEKCENSKIHLLHLFFVFQDKMEGSSPGEGPGKDDQKQTSEKNSSAEKVPSQTSSIEEELELSEGYGKSYETEPPAYDDVVPGPSKSTGMCSFNIPYDIDGQMLFESEDFYNTTCKGKLHLLVNLLETPECDMNVTGLPERYVIMLRSARVLDSKLVRTRLTICESHRDLYTTAKYIFKLGGQSKCGLGFCLEDTTTSKKGAKKRPFTKKSGNRALSHEATQKFLARGKFVPWGRLVCANCRVNKGPTYLQETPILYSNVLNALEFWAGQEGKIDTPSGDTDTTDPEPFDPDFASPEKQTPVKMWPRTASSGSEAGAIANSNNQLWELIKSVLPNAQRRHFFTGQMLTYANLSSMSVWRVRKSVSNGIAAVFAAVGAKQEDHEAIWSDIVGSGELEKTLQISSGKFPIEEIIKAYNCAVSYEHKIQIITCITQSHSFAELDKFNLKKFQTEVEVDDEEQLLPTVAEEDENLKAPSAPPMDEIEVADGAPLRKRHKTGQEQKPEKDVVYWNPPLTYHLFRRARIHQKEHAAALQPVLKETRHVFRLDPAIFELIIDFITSENHQQNVAHGTLPIRLDSGEVVRIAGVIRKITNAQLVKKLSVMLEEMKHKVPAQSTLFKIVQTLRAKKARAITGIDSTYENHRIAFETLFKIVDKCALVLVEEEGQRTVKNVREDISASAKYVLSSFPYHLEYDSKCESHCINFGCSDPKEKKLQQQCTVEHTEKCDHCMILPKIIKDMRKMVETASPHLKEEEAAEMLFDISAAHESIEHYLKSLLRHKVSQDYWDSLLEKADPKIALVTMDFAMKMLPRVHREQQSQWFGKKGED